MPKSTRRAGAMRAGFEYFDRRQQGPWTLLRPLFRGWGLVVPLALAVLLLAGLGWNPYVVLGLLAVLFLASFAITWQLVGLLLRSRAVLFVLGVLAAANWWLTDVFGDIAGNIVLGVLVVGLLVFPPTGRYLGRRMWCVLDRHRIRACLKVCKVRTMNLDGSLPFLLWARPSQVGERVWIWVRAGASGEDIEDALSYIAPACFARDARIHTVRKLATLVAVDIIRRDPLATSEAIASPLSELATYVKDKVTGEGTETISSATVADITAIEPAPMIPEPRKGSRKTTTPKPTTATPDGGGVVISGEDLSDYVD